MNHIGGTVRGLGVGLDGHGTGQERAERPRIKIMYTTRTASNPLRHRKLRLVARLSKALTAVGALRMRVESGEKGRRKRVRSVAQRERGGRG